MRRGSAPRAQTLLNYEVRPEFFDTIKDSKLRIENYGEECLYDKDVPTNGVKFSLANNHDGWKEKTETDLNVKQDPAEALLSTLMAAPEPEIEPMPEPAAEPETVEPPEDEQSAEA